MQNLYHLEADAFNALAHPIRLEILELLREGERCVCHIQAMLDLRQAYISQHLNVLRRAGLVGNRKEGVRVYYQVTDPALFDLIDGLKAILQEAGEWGPVPAIQAAPPAPRKLCKCPQCSPALT